MTGSVAGKYSVECPVGTVLGDVALSFSGSGVDVDGGVAAAAASCAAFLALRFIRTQKPAMAESSALMPPTTPPTIAPTFTFFFFEKLVVDSPVGIETVGMLTDTSLKVYDGSEKVKLVAVPFPVAVATVPVAVTSAGFLAAADSAASMLKPFPEATSRYAHVGTDTADGIASV